MSRSKPAAVVVGLDSVTGLQTARWLAGRGVPVIGVARNPKHPCARTNVCAACHVTDTEGPELIATLEDIAQRLDRKAVLFPCADMSVLLISRNRDALAAWYEMVLPDPPVVETLLDKSHFSAFAQDHRFTTPRTAVLRSLEDARQAAAQLRFPCILKPALKTPEWKACSAEKVLKVESAAQLLLLQQRFGNRVLVLQEMVPGACTGQFTCNCYFDRRGRLVRTFTTRKLRQWPPETGVATLAQECRNDAVEALTIRLFQTAKLRGLGYLEVKQDQRTGELLIIEPNIGRPTGRSAMAETAGVDLLYAMYCDALGWPLPAARAQADSARKWIHLRRDLQAAGQSWRKGDLKIADWVRSFGGWPREALFAWRDPLPFGLDCCHALRKLHRKGKIVRERTAITAAVTAPSSGAD